MDGVSIPPGPLMPPQAALSSGVLTPIDTGHAGTLGGVGMIDAKDKLTPQEVAQLFHVDPKTVARWARQGKLNYSTTLGGHRRYSRRQVEALIMSHEAQKS